MTPTDTARTRAEAAYARLFPWRLGLPVVEEWVSGYMDGDLDGAAARREEYIKLVEALFDEAKKQLDEVETDMGLIGASAKMQAVRAVLTALRAQ